MARVPYASRESVGSKYTGLFDQLERERGKPVENVFTAIANIPEVCEAVLHMATSLRKQTVIDRQFRELAVLTVGLETKSEYEFDHHWNSAVKAGVPRAQLDQLAHFETSDVFNEQQRAVMRYAKEATRFGEVSEPTWGALCSFLDLKERMELVVTVAWYNCVVRILLPLKIEKEEWLKRA
jgi:alkylhydroperoxidase family enzyme